jgi:hypothetical protein
LPRRVFEKNHSARIGPVPHKGQVATQAARREELNAPSQKDRDEGQLQRIDQIPGEKL